jgi:hypothetical protein
MYGIKRKPISVKNPQANAILEHINAVLGNMLRTSELDMAELVKASDINVFYQTLHGQFALPTIQHLRPPQVQQYLDEIRYLIFQS